MISGSEIKNILLRIVKNDPVLGVIAEIVKDKHAPVKEDDVKERIVIVIPGGTDNGQFSRSYPRICIYIPDVKVPIGNSNFYKPDNNRLTELENHCEEKFRSSIYHKHGEEVCIFVKDTITMEEDAETYSHFLNVRLRFEVVNTKL